MEHSQQIVQRLRWGRSRTAMAFLMASCLALFGSSLQAQPELGDGSDHLRLAQPLGGDSSACDADVMELGQLFEGAWGFRCNARGTLTAVWGTWSQPSAVDALVALHDILGLSFDPASVEIRQTQMSEAGLTTNNLVRLSADGYPIAGSNLDVISLAGFVVEIRGAILTAGFFEANSEDPDPPLHQDGQADPESFESDGVVIEGPWFYLPGLALEDVDGSLSAQIAEVEAPYLGDRPFLFTKETTLPSDPEVGGSTTVFRDLSGVAHYTRYPSQPNVPSVLDYRDGCRELACALQAIRTVVALPSMRTVQDRLRTSLRYAPTGGGSTSISGEAVVAQLLQEYSPAPPYGGDAVDRMQHQLRIETLFDSTFERLAVSQKDRPFLANVTHALWIELVLSRSMPPTVLQPTHPILGWSLANLSRLQIDQTLFGPTALRMSPTYSYHWKHYPLASSVLQRMAPHNPGIASSNGNIIPRLLDAVGDAQLHVHHRYYPRFTGDGKIFDSEGDLDLSESYQRRAGGCGMPSYMATLLARSLNIPAGVENPRIVAGNGRPSRDGHRYSFYPTLKAIVHGDALASSKGAKSERMLWNSETVHFRNQRFSQAIQDQLLAFDDLKAHRGAYFWLGSDFYHDPGYARAWKCEDRNLGCGVVDTSAFPSVELYLGARFATYRYRLLNGGHTQFDRSRYPLLDEVATYLPLEGNKLSQGSIVNRSIRGADATVIGGPALFPIAGKLGKGVAFLGASATVPEHPSIRRGDEEFTLSLWYWPAHLNGGVVDGTLVELAETGAHDEVWQLRVNQQGILDFSLATLPASVGVQSTAKLNGVGPYHVAVTFETGVGLRLFIDGQLEASTAASGRINLGVWDASNYPPVFAPKHVELQVAVHGFSGVLDELLLLHPALTQAEVAKLHATY